MLPEEYRWIAVQFEPDGDARALLEVARLGAAAERRRARVRGGGSWRRPAFVVSVRGQQTAAAILRHPHDPGTGMVQTLEARGGGTLPGRGTSAPRRAAGTAGL